ncbi:MAG: hypothetical protein KAR38_14880, partial [Calditrichia bacterium]|nr:hypothetical protein [Calditrichia bacterium]
TKTYSPVFKEWIKKEHSYKKETFSKQIPVERDTVIFKDFKQNENSLIIEYTLFSTDEEQPLTAYELKIIYYKGNILKLDSSGYISSDGVEVENRFKEFRRGGSPTFQHSSSGASFKNFRMKYFQVKGNTPVGDGPFLQEVEFKIYQKSF